MRIRLRIHISKYQIIFLPNTILHLKWQVYLSNKTLSIFAEGYNNLKTVGSQTMTLNNFDMYVWGKTSYHFSKTDINIIFRLFLMINNNLYNCNSFWILPYSKKLMVKLQGDHKKITNKNNQFIKYFFNNVLRTMHFNSKLFYVGFN